MRYQTRPEFVNATRWYKHGDHPAVQRVELSPDDAPGLHAYWKAEYGIILGHCRVMPGDWIVEGPHPNTIYVLDDESFRKRFTRVQDDDEPRTVGH